MNVIPRLSKAAPEENGLRYLLFTAARKDNFFGNPDQRSDRESDYCPALFLDREDPDKDISLYIHSPAAFISAGLAIYDTMQLIRRMYRPSASAWPRVWAQFCCAPALKENAMRSPIQQFNPSGNGRRTGSSSGCSNPGA